jgi:regulator of sigma E protease
VLIAGVTMNMLLALCLFIGISYGTVQVSVDDPVFGARVTKSYIMVTEVSKESPAFKAGIVPGSIILSMKSNGEDAKLTTATSLITFISKNQNNAFAITYRTPNGEDKKTTVAAVYGILENKKALGIAVEQVGEVKTTFLEAVELGYTKTVTMTSMTFTGLKDVLTSAFSGKNVIDSLSGPVGIAKIVGETSEYGYVAVLTLVAVLSINLAIFNALPLPALDGGRIVVVLIESIIRKKVPFKYYSWVNVVGFSLLLLLLIIVTIHDLKG